VEADILYTLYFTYVFHVSGVPGVFPNIKGSETQKPPIPVGIFVEVI